jgi:hypothetical protein
MCKAGWLEGRGAGRGDESRGQGRALRRPAWLIAALLGLSTAGLAGRAAAAGSDGVIPGAEISLPESQIGDRFYSYLIGLIDANACGAIDDKQLNKVLGSYKGKTSIPFEKIREIKRECVSGTSVRDVSVSFKEELSAPVPYSILGYHPGAVKASQSVGFLEWYLPAQKIRSSGSESIELSQVFVFGIYDGWAVVDIDAWVDKLLGGLLDDTRLVVVALFKYKGDWHGLAAGYGPSGEGRSGIFNFHTNKILFPTPRELQALAPYFRNFVVRTKHVNAPLPPAKHWRHAR